MGIDPILITVVITSVSSLLLSLRNTFKSSKCCHGAIDIQFEAPEQPQGVQITNPNLENQIKALQDEIHRITPQSITNVENENKWEAVI